MALNNFVDFAKYKLEEKIHVIAIFLDPSQALNIVDHEFLQIILKNTGLLLIQSIKANQKLFG